MRLIDADALDAEFTDLRFNADRTLKHWGDRQDWCLHGSEVEKLIENAPTVSGWVSVKDRLPCNTQDVLVYAKGLLVKIGAYIVQSNEWWVFGLGGEYIVEYWMPLPEPPEEVLNGNEH